MGLLVASVAVALAMDAFAVALGAAAAQGGLGLRALARLAWHFGFFQAAMAAMGWLAGAALEGWIAGWDHWLAAGLLTAVALRMLADALGRGEADVTPPDATRGWSLVGLSVATSIDALAAGVGLAALSLPVLWPAAVIGATAAALTVAGGLGGRLLGRRCGRLAAVIGGLVLLLVACSIVLQHERAEAAATAPATSRVGTRHSRVTILTPATRTLPDRPPGRRSKRRSGCTSSHRVTAAR